MKRFRAGPVLGSRYGMEIRTAVPADAAALAALLEAADHPVQPHILAEQLEALRYSSGTALLALEWGPPSGIVVLHWYPVLDQVSPVAQVTLLLVAPDGRRRGVGRQLLKAASQAARMAGCATLQLLSPGEDTGLPQFCEATGFTRTGGCFARPLRKKG